MAIKIWNKTILLRLGIIVIILTTYSNSHAQIENETGRVVLKDKTSCTGNIYYYYDQIGDLLITDSLNNKKTIPLKNVEHIELNTGRKYKGIKIINKNNDFLIAQILVESPKINLYKREEKGSSYFYIEKDSSCYKLENNVIEVNKDGRTFQKKDLKYIGVLTMLMFDRPDLKHDIQKTKYNKQSISNIIILYNKGQITYHYLSDNKEIKNPKYYGFIEVKTLASDYYGDNSTTSFSIGESIGLHLYMNKLSKHSLLFALSNYYYKLGTSNSQLSNFEIIYRNDLFKTQVFNWNLSIRFIGLGIYKELNLDGTVEDKYYAPSILGNLSAGTDIKLTKKSELYFQVNQLFAPKEYLRNITFGYKHKL